MVVKMFLDTSNIEEYKKYKDLICGGTTNPSIMSTQGVAKEQYEAHTRLILDVINEGVLSVEVTNVLPSKMYWEAKQYSEWDPRIVIKIPCPFYLDKNTVARVTEKIEVEDLHNLDKTVKLDTDLTYINTLPLIYQLSKEGVPLNITCGFGYEQARDVAAIVEKANGSAKNNYFSLFWGRLLDNYVKEKKAGEVYSEEDLTKLIDLSSQEVEECADQLNGTNIQLILGSSRLPKTWVKNAQETGKLNFVNKEAYRALLKVAQPVNAIPTIAPSLFEAARYNEHSSNALKGFVNDFLKLKGQ